MGWGGIREVGVQGSYESPEFRRGCAMVYILQYFLPQSPGVLEFCLLWFRLEWLFVGGCRWWVVAIEGASVVLLVILFLG